MKTRFRYAAIAALLVLIGCERAAIRSSESLVGAEQLPSITELRRETIHIVRHSGDEGLDSHLLIYELRPDDALTVSHVVRPVRPGDVDEFNRGEERFQISAATADRLRHMLWRVRPERLEGLEYVAIPSGCQYHLHDWGEVNVAFIGPDEEVGAFMLPDHRNCDTPAAVEARSMIQAVFQALPQSSVANAFSGLP